MGFPRRQGQRHRCRNRLRRRDGRLARGGACAARARWAAALHRISERDACDLASRVFDPGAAAVAVGSEVGTLALRFFPSAGTWRADVEGRKTVKFAALNPAAIWETIMD